MNPVNVLRWGYRRASGMTTAGFMRILMLVTLLNPMLNPH